MILLGVDLETTGLDIAEAEITEIGMVTFDTDSQQVVRIYSTLVKPLGLIPEDVQAMTGISQRVVERFGVPWEVALSTWNEMASESDYLVGHNIREFDAKILGRLGGKVDKPMIDTLTDLPLEKTVSSKKLGHLAVDILNIANPFPHRAATDVMTTLMLLNAFPIEQVVQYAEAESRLMVAKLRKEDPAFERKKAAVKRLGYRWTGQPECRWQKVVKEFEIDPEKEKARRVGVKTTAIKYSGE